MARLRIDNPEIDVEALEARIEAAIERKRGSRFDDADLERLRATRLRPRLRREELPRGFLKELDKVRPRLPEVPPSPGPAPSEAVRVERSEPRSVEHAAIHQALYHTDQPGLAGRFRRLVRRFSRRFYATTIDLEAAFEKFRDETRARVELGDDRLEEQIDRTRDRLQEHLDRRLDATTDRLSDWIGAHVSELTGTLERRSDRQLQLLHNLVFELSHVRLQIAELQDRLLETREQLALAEERQRTFEAMVLRERGE